MCMAICPVCSNGDLVEEIRTDVMTYKGVTEDVEYYISICHGNGIDNCGSELGLPDQVERNVQNARAFWKRIDDNVDPS